MSTQTTPTTAPAFPTLPCVVSWCDQSCEWEHEFKGRFQRTHRRTHGYWEAYALEYHNPEDGHGTYPPIFETLCGVDVEGPENALTAAKHLRKLAQRVAGAL